MKYFLAALLFASASSPSFAADLFDLPDDSSNCSERLNGAPRFNASQTSLIKKYILSRKIAPSSEVLRDLKLQTFDSKFLFGGELNEHYELSVVFPKSTHDVFKFDLYKSLKSWVEENKSFPPTLAKFRDFLGIQPEQSKYFQRLFNRRYGLFRGYEEDFIAGARKHPLLSEFLERYQDVRIFNPDIEGLVKAHLQSSNQLLVSGYVNGQPLADGIMDALPILQNNLVQNETTPSLVFPAYGKSSGLPEVFFNPSEKRFVIPKQLHIQGGLGNKFTINETPVGPRNLKPDTGAPRQMEPGKTMIGVHPQAVFTPYASDSDKPSVYETTGSINAKGFNVSATAIGARVSAIQNAEHVTSLLLVEKISGSLEELGYGLEAQFRTRRLPYNETPISVKVGEDIIHYPRGFSDLNKHYGEDGVVRDLPILCMTFGDSHSPQYDPAYFEAVRRQFIDPKTALKNTDGKPVHIFSFVTNDHLNNDFGSRHTTADLESQQKLVNDPLEYDLHLHMKHALSFSKDLQRAMTETRGYTPHFVMNYSNHDYDRFSAKLKSGDFVFDAKNANVYLKMKQYKDAGKNFFKEYLFQDVGVSYPDFVHILGPKDAFSVGNAKISHGHTGGIYGKPVSAVGRKSAQGSAILGDSHVAMYMNSVFNAGHATLPFDYARGFFNKGYKAMVIQTPLHTQLLIYMNGSFYGAQTHGIPELEFRPGYPQFKDLPLDAQTVPDNVSKIDQYRTGTNTNPFKP